MPKTTYSDQHFGSDLPLLYNGLIEVAMRVLLCINEFSTVKVTKSDIYLLSYFTQFGGDFGAARNMHLPTMGRANGYIIRQDAIDISLIYLQKMGVVEIDMNDEETTYSIHPDHINFIDFISAEYLIGIKLTAEYIYQKHQADLNNDVFDQMKKIVMDLLLEPMTMAGTEVQRFLGLKVQYRLDYFRMEGLINSVEIFKKLDAPTIGHPILSADIYDKVYNAGVKEMRSIGHHSTEVTDLLTSMGIETQ